MAKKIGIDLGTTYSCVSYVDDTGTLRVIENLEGEQTTPSVVFFDPNGGAVVGSTARSEGAMNPECLVERVKNYMGDPDYKAYANGQDYSATAVSSLILKKLITDAETALGEEIEGAVITCPAYFGVAARNATKQAGENVLMSNGQPLKVLKIMDEPTAAAIAYGNAKKEDMDKTVLIYDLGGGTFDCTVMKIAFHGDDRKMEVVTTGGNHLLGGKDWDAQLGALVRSKFCEATGCDEDEMMNDVETQAWFSENIEKAKMALTSRETTSLTPSFNGQRQKVEITRAEFDDATAGKLEETISLVNDMLTAKGMSINDIDEIILVGGSTKMLQVQKKLEQEYGKPISSFEPNKAVAMGAALMANSMSGEEENGMPMGGEPADGAMGMSLLGGNGQSTVVIENLTKSYGLRIYVGTAGNKEEKVLNILLKDTPKPCKSETGVLTITGEPALVDSVGLLVLENDSLEQQIERDMCREIYEEGEIKLETPVAGDSPVTVEFDVDVNGILTLRLREVNTGKMYETKPVIKGDASNDESMRIVQQTLLN